MNIFILEDDNDFLKVIFQVFNHQPSLECMLDHHTYTRWFTTEILLIWIFPHNLCFIVFIRPLSRCFFCWKEWWDRFIWFYVILRQTFYDKCTLHLLHDAIRYFSCFQLSWANIFSIIAHMKNISLKFEWFY